MPLNLFDIAVNNIPHYQTQFEKQPDAVKNKVAIITANLSFSINMGLTALLSMLNDRWKNKFELCAEINGMSLDDYSKLSLDMQAILMCTIMSAKNKTFGIRRVDFSNRFIDGLKFNYLALNMNIAEGHAIYGEYCVIIRLPHSINNAALKYDSLKHYFNDMNEFDEVTCHKDLLPLSNVNLLLLDKFALHLESETLDDIKFMVEEDSDPIEVITTNKIYGFDIQTVIITQKEYKKIVELNKKPFRDHVENEVIQNYMKLQFELRRCGIKLVFRDMEAKND